MWRQMERLEATHGALDAMLCTSRARLKSRGSSIPAPVNVEAAAGGSKGAAGQELAPDDSPTQVLVRLGILACARWLPVSARMQTRHHC